MKIQRLSTRLAARPQAAGAGFSLAELMVVIVIIGLLGTVVAPKLMSKFGKAQVGTAKTDILRISDAVTEFYMDNQRYPETIEELVTKGENNESYLNGDKVPTDPWGNEYVLEESDGEILIWCYGADKSQGGDGNDRDFNNKDIINKEI